MTNTNTVHADRFDQAEWRDTYTEIDAIRSHAENLSWDYAQAEPLTADVFQLFYQPTPKLKDHGDIAAAGLRNRAVVETLTEATEVQDLRNYTQLDRYGAAMGVLSVEDAVRQHLSKVNKDADDAAQKAEDEAEANPDDEGAQEAAQAAREALQGQADKDGQALRAALAQAAQDTKDQLEDEADAFQAAGVEPGEVQRLDFEERSRLAKMLTGPKLRDFRRILGRFRTVASASRATRTEYDRDEMYDLRLSNNIEDVLAHELVALTSDIPAVADDALRRFAEGELLTKKYRGTEKVGDGPIVVLVDCSGSMSFPAGEWTREAWAKGLAMALVGNARASQRAFTLISFGTGIRIFRSSDWGPNAIVDFLTWFEGGGTVMDTALDAALPELTGSKADLVVITDGEFKASKDRLAAVGDVRADRGARVWGVSIAAAVTPQFDALCDNVRRVDELAPEAMTDMLRSI